MQGDGTQHNALDWDNRIYAAKCKQDWMGGSRVVETWHAGNLLWYQLRQPQGDTQRYINAVSQQSSLVLNVHLCLTSYKRVLQRRQQDISNQQRLPMQDKIKESDQLFQALNPPPNFWNIPNISIDNDLDGEDGIQQMLKHVLAFLQRHYHKRVIFEL